MKLNVKVTIANLVLPQIADLTDIGFAARPAHRFVDRLMPLASARTKLAVYSELTKSLSPQASKDAVDSWCATAQAMLHKDAQKAIPEIVKGLAYPVRFHAYKYIIETAHTSQNADAAGILQQAQIYLHRHPTAVLAKQTLKDLDIELNLLARRRQMPEGLAAS